MDGLRPLDDDAVPDVFVAGRPYQITQARAYFRVKHMQRWGARVTLHPWETWEQLEVRVGARLGKHLWYPSHWDSYYASLPDMPASTPGATPQTLKMAREKRWEAHGQTALFPMDEEVE